MIRWPSAARARVLREGRWLRTERAQLRGKTLGLIGFGGIALELARLRLAIATMMPNV
jgi:D-3-phosphoglycerate dehydrogenase / 2-oxoglutarate reductase